MFWTRRELLPPLAVSPSVRLCPNSLAAASLPARPCNRGTGLLSFRFLRVRLPLAQTTWQVQSSGKTSKLAVNSWIRAGRSNSGAGVPARRQRPAFSGMTNPRSSRGCTSVVSGTLCGGVGDLPSHPTGLRATLPATGRSQSAGPVWRRYGLAGAKYRQPYASLLATRIRSCWNS
jgi:hypothetical protein